MPQIRTRVSFADSEPSEKEFFEEYDKYNLTSLWFILIFILRSLAPLCFALQISTFEFPESVSLYMKHLSISNNSAIYLSLKSNCTKEEVQNDTKLEEACREVFNRKELVLRMSMLKSTGLCVGTILGGILSDLFGRRLISFYSSLAWNILSWVLVGAKSKMLVEVVYVIIIVTGGIVNVITYVSFGEIANKRNRFLIVYTIPTYVLGGLLLDHLSRTLTVWRYLLIFISSTNCLMIFTCWYMPESPRWLLNNNKKKKAYQQLNEISGRIYNVSRTDDEEFVPLNKATLFLHMFLFLFRRKFRNFLLISFSMTISSLLYNCSKMKAILSYVKGEDLGFLAAVSETMGYLFLVPVYIFLGKRFGLFCLYVLLIIQSFFAIFAFDIEDIYYTAFGILFGASAICLNWLYYLDIFPTFLRGTVMGFSFCIFGITMLVSTLLAKETTFEANTTDKYDNIKNELSSIYYYALLLSGSILGLSVLLLPETANQDLPNFKLCM